MAQKSFCTRQEFSLGKICKDKLSIFFSYMIMSQVGPLEENSDTACRMILRAYRWLQHEQGRKEAELSRGRS